MEGPMVALLMPFKPNTLEIDDAAFTKYLDVSTAHDTALTSPQHLMLCLEHIQRWSALCAASLGGWHQERGR